MTTPNGQAPAAGSPNPSGSGAQLITANLVSRMLAIPEETLSKWRQVGTGPAYVRLPNGRIRYDIAVVNTWIDTLRSS